MVSLPHQVLNHEPFHQKSCSFVTVFSGPKQSSILSKISDKDGAPSYGLEKYPLKGTLLGHLRDSVG